MTESFMMIGKTAVLFLFTLFCFRLMGYRSLGDMEPLDYVVVLGIGEIMGSPLSGEASMIRPMVAIATLTALQIILSSLYSKMPKVGKVMEGGPVPVIRNGKLIKKNLLIHRIDQAAVMEELRIKGLRDEKDVDIEMCIRDRQRRNQHNQKIHPPWISGVFIVRDADAVPF